MIYSSDLSYQLFCFNLFLKSNQQFLTICIFIFNQQVFICDIIKSNFSATKKKTGRRNNCSDWKNVFHINELKMDFTVRLMDRYINICKDLKGPNISLQIYLQNCLNTKLSKSCKSGSFVH